MRVRTYPGRLASIDYGPLLDDLADDVVDVAKTIVPVLSGDLRSTIRKRKAGKRKVRITAGGKRGAMTGEPVDYAGYVERGTSKMSAQPFLRPALYRYRAAR